MGIPQVNIDQLNPKNLLTGFTVPDLPMERQTGTVRLDGGVYNFESLAMRLTRGKLKTAPDWSEWQQSEGVMLDQYEEQGLFGEPVPAKDKDAIFNLVWTYVVTRRTRIAFFLLFWARFYLFSLRIAIFFALL